jgi:hypothetical protein
MADSEGATSFARDIKPLFRQIDLDHMGRMGVKLDDYEWMSNTANAQNVYDFVAGTKQPKMPIGGPFWSQEQLDLFARWMKNGCPP